MAKKAGSSPGASAGRYQRTAPAGATRIAAQENYSPNYTETTYTKTTILAQEPSPPKDLSPSYLKGAPPALKLDGTEERAKGFILYPAKRTERVTGTIVSTAPLQSKVSIVYKGTVIYSNDAPVTVRVTDTTDKAAVEALAEARRLRPALARPEAPEPRFVAAMGEQAAPPRAIYDAPKDVSGVVTRAKQGSSEREIKGITSLRAGNRQVVREEVKKTEKTV